MDAMIAELDCRLSILEYRARLGKTNNSPGCHRYVVDVIRCPFQIRFQQNVLSASPVRLIDRPDNFITFPAFSLFLEQHHGQSLRSSRLRNVKESQNLNASYGLLESSNTLRLLSVSVFVRLLAGKIFSPPNRHNCRNEQIQDQLRHLVYLSLGAKLRLLGPDYQSIRGR